MFHAFSDFSIILTSLPQTLSSTYNFLFLGADTTVVSLSSYAAGPIKSEINDDASATSDTFSFLSILLA